MGAAMTTSTFPPDEGADPQAPVPAIVPTPTFRHPCEELGMYPANFDPHALCYSQEPCLPDGSTLWHISPCVPFAPVPASIVPEVSVLPPGTDPPGQLPATGPVIDGLAPVALAFLIAGAFVLGVSHLPGIGRRR